MIFRIVLFFVIGYLGVSFYQAMRIVKAQQAQMQAQMEEKRARFEKLTPEVMDEAEDQELKEGIMMHIYKKEDVDFDHVRDLLTPEEIVVYTLNSMDLAVNFGRGSVYNFFTTYAKAFVNDLVPSYEAVGATELALLAKKITDLVIMEQTGQIPENSSELATFQEYTQEYLDLVVKEDLTHLIANYIREHKDAFIASC